MLSIAKLYDEHIRRETEIRRIGKRLRKRGNIGIETNKDIQDAIGILMILFRRGDLIERKKKISVLSQGSRKNVKYKRIRI